MEPLVKLMSIQKSYGKRTVLRLENLTINRGELYLLTGPNGSGKSTLLSVLALLCKPDRGEIYFNGERTTWTNANLLRLRKQVTLLHQTPYLFTGTVLDNVAFGPKRHGIAGRDLHSRIVRSLEAVGLAGFEERSAAELSGGEARRVALARALAIEPEMLLLDEPLANVDRQSARLIEQVVCGLPARGTTVIFSSHDPNHECRIDCQRISLVDGTLENPYTLQDNGWKEVSYACI